MRVPLPPVWVRRCAIAPAVVLTAFLLVTTLPLWAIVAVALTSLVPGRMRVPRVAWMVTFYLVWDSAALVALFTLWVASGFGWKIRGPRFQRAHHVLAGVMLRVLFRQARWVLRLRISLDVAPGPDRPGPPPAGPLLVACRHGGPGDSFVLIHLLLNQLRREPRIVLKSSLQWDPAIDVILNRLPNEFITPAPFDPSGRRRPGADTAERIGRLAADLDDDDALVIFPEGGQFTPERRRRRIEGLRTRGALAHADRAEAMAHVMAPRPGGLFAAMDAAPTARMLVVAHTGLERLRTLGDLWRDLPMDKEIVLHGWLLESEEIPRAGELDDTARVDWLYGWWERVDGWIDARQGGVRETDGAVADGPGPVAPPAEPAVARAGEPPVAPGAAVVAGAAAVAAVAGGASLDGVSPDGVVPGRSGPDGTPMDPVAPVGAAPDEAGTGVVGDLPSSP